jgi:ubiquinone/menaquinone biosynthesis C-methylase UbiE
MDNQVEISKGIYQSNADWNVQVDIAEQIIIYFPTLSADSIQVLSKAILNKLTQGVKYSDEMEKMISMVYPKVIEGLQQSSEQRMKESKRKLVQGSTLKPGAPQEFKSYKSGQKDIIRETGYQQPKFGNTERNKERFGHLEKILPQDINVEVLLDIGAGNAELGAYFGKMLDTKQVYALDIYPEKDFVQPSTESTVIYKQMKDFVVPLPDRSVDMVMMMMFLHHVNEKGKLKVLKEIQRVLKPGGIVFIREHDVPSGDKKFEKYLDDVHSKFNPNPLEHSVEKTYYQSRKELKDMFIKNNFLYLDESSYSTKNPQAIYHELYVLQ